MTHNPTDRKRGGQPGNVNAFRHGMYSKFLKPEERRKREGSQRADLAEEIQLVRVIIHRIISTLDTSGNLPQLEHYLSIISLAGQRLGNMLRTQKLWLAADEVTWWESMMDEITRSLYPHLYDDMLPEGLASDQEKAAARSSLMEEHFLAEYDRLRAELAEKTAEYQRIKARRTLPAANPADPLGLGNFMTPAQEEEQEAPLGELD